jgi:hypothetical protein
MGYGFKLNKQSYEMICQHVNYILVKSTHLGEKEGFLEELMIKLNDECFSQRHVEKLKYEINSEIDFFKENGKNKEHEENYYMPYIVDLIFHNGFTCDYRCF